MMAVVFDADILIDLLHPKPNPDTKARLDHLVKELQARHEQVLVPTPSLAEFLVKADKASQEYLTKLTTSKSFRVSPFGIKAAVECAISLGASIAKGDKRGGVKGTWAKVKFDRQIIAIAVAEGARAVYSDDDHLHQLGKIANLRTLRTSDLPLPPEAAQGQLPLDQE